MENWGLITYRETALLYDPKMSSNGDKEWVATVIAHELAHMVRRGDLMRADILWDDGGAGGRGAVRQPEGHRFEAAST